MQVPAALAALGPHEVLKLGDLFVEAIDVLVKEPTEKLVSTRAPQPVSLPHGHLWQGWQDEHTSRGDAVSDSQTRRACWYSPTSGGCSGSVPAE